MKLFIFLIFTFLFVFVTGLILISRNRKDYKVEYEINIINEDSVEVHSSTNTHYIIPFDSLEETILKDNL